MLKVLKIVSVFRIANQVFYDIDEFWAFNWEPLNLLKARSSGGNIVGVGMRD